MEIFDAHSQWAKRPADERFWDIPELRLAMLEERKLSREWDGSASKIEFATHPESHQLVARMKGRDGSGSLLTNWTMSQICSRLGTPQAFLNQLPPSLVAQILNHRAGDGQATTWSNDEVKLLVRNSPTTSGEKTVQAITSTRYGRLWNSDVARMCQELVDRGWQVPPARPAQIQGERTRIATAADVVHAGKHGVAVRVGDQIAPAGVYAGDRDMFVFLVNEQYPITLDGFTGFRGVFIENSQVGAKTFSIRCFLYDSVCGNHIVWDAYQVASVSMRHTRGVVDRWVTAVTAVTTAAALPAATETKMIEAARTIKLGDNKEQTIDAVYTVLGPGVSRENVIASYALAEGYADVHHASPQTVWGMVSGLTRHSQTFRNAGERDEIDSAAGKLLTRFAGKPLIAAR